MGMANKSSKQQVLDKLTAQYRRELEASWDAAESKAVEGGGEDIHQFVDDLHGLCGRMGQSSLKAFLEERDDQQRAKKKRPRPKS